MATWDIKKIAKGMWSTMQDWDYFQTNEVGQHLAQAAEALLRPPPPANPTETTAADPTPTPSQTPPTPVTEPTLGTQREETHPSSFDLTDTDRDASGAIAPEALAFQAALDAPEPSPAPLASQATVAPDPTVIDDEVITAATATAWVSQGLADAATLDLAPDAIRETDATEAIATDTIIAADANVSETIAAAIADTVWGTDNWSALAQANLAQMAFSEVGMTRLDPDSPEHEYSEQDWADPFAHDPYAEDPFATLAELELPLAALPLIAPTSPSVPSPIPESATESAEIASPKQTLPTGVEGRHDDPQTLNAEPPPTLDERGMDAQGGAAPSEAEPIATQLSAAELQEFTAFFQSADSASPAAVEPETPSPDIVQTKPTTEPEPAVLVDPMAAEPELIVSNVTESPPTELADPETIESEPSEPETLESAALDFEASESEIAESESEAVEPETLESAALDFEVSEPEAADSTPIIPALAESVPPEPALPERLPPEFASPSPGLPEQHKNYVRFITDVQALLSTLEQELLTLTPPANPTDLECLMQIAEQLKGTATDVEQETIKTIAHNLEDVFRALLASVAPLDEEIKALLDRDVELLRLALRREWVQDRSQDTELLQAATVVFGQLQAKLAATVTEPPPPPAPAELDFDLTQAIFGTGVEARLKDFEALLARQPTTEAVQRYWHNQVDVFCRVADALHLPGFRAVVEAGAAAIAAHPDQVLTLASLLLANLRTAQAQVLAGDCIGGSVSSELAAWLVSPPDRQAEPLPESSPAEASELPIEPLDDAPDDTPDDAPDDALDELFLTPESPLPTLPLPTLPLPTLPLAVSPLPEQVRSKQIQQVSDLAAAPPPSEPSSSHVVPEQPAPDLADELAELATMSPPLPVPKSLRIELGQLERLNHLVGELRINQNQMAQRDRQLQALLQQLNAGLQQQQRTLAQLQATTLQPDEASTAPPPDAALLATVIAQTQTLSQTSEDLGLLVRNTHSGLEQEQQLAKQLQDNMDAARLVSLGALLKRFEPMVKQLALIHKKPVELQLRGTAVCVDKTIAENLYDALLHLVRNAFDHGIEPAEQRRQADKPEQGTITITAAHQGNRTLIQVQDDGQGLAIARICERAVAQDLLTVDAAQAWQAQPQPDAGLLALLCTPGFSTAAEVNALSGQGMGLARVKTQLAQIKGQLQVRSQPGQGCCFTLQIRTPLLNARLLICQAGQARYGLVTNEIEQVLIPGAQLRWQAGQKVLDWNQAEQTDTVPIYALADLLPLPSRWRRPLAEPPLERASLAPSELAPILTPPADARPVLLLRTPAGLIGLEVTQILDEQELVIKPLGAAIAPPPYIYGCTVLADGQLALVLDGILLVQQAEQQGIRKSW